MLDQSRGHSGMAMDWEWTAMTIFGASHTAHRETKSRMVTPWTGFICGVIGCGVDNQ